MGAGSAGTRLEPAALHGLAGEVVRTIEPHTEAEPAGLLIAFLVAFGCAVGPGPHAVADGSEHPARLSAVLVGNTSRGRKGTAWANVCRVMWHADRRFVDERVMGGLASGEGLIATVRDPDADAESADTALPRNPVADRRLLIIEPELARTLGVAGRDGNTLSAIIRDAYDTGNLRVMTRHDPLVATGAHISILGQITAEELTRRLSDIEIANGVANRFLFVSVRRSKLLPDGGNLSDAEVAGLGQKVAHALFAARRIAVLRRNDTAGQLWARMYGQIADSTPDGLLGAITAGAEAQLLRLSVVYALLDGTSTIDTDHLLAAWALLSYSEASAQALFARRTGDPWVADVNSRELPDSTDPEFSFRYVDIGSVDSTGAVDLPADEISFADAPSRARRLAIAGSTVISTVRTYLRAIARVPCGGLVFSTGFAVVEARPDVHPGFLYYACRSDNFVDGVVARSTGVSYPAINAGELASISLLLPPEEEQRRIADFLDDQVTRIDKALAIRRQQLVLLEASMQSWLEGNLASPTVPRQPLKAFVSVITSGPRGWGNFVGTPAGRSSESPTSLGLELRSTGPTWVV